jgi:hypothetical protein
MYTTASTNTAEGGQLSSAIDFIAHENHKGGCVPFCEWGGEEDGGQRANVNRFVSQDVENRISACSNSAILKVLKVLPLLEI